MEGRVYPNPSPNPSPTPSPKPLHSPTAAAAAAAPSTKPLPYYRRPPPPPLRRRRRRGCSCCKFLFWLTLLLLGLSFLAAIAGGVFYLVYRPERPSFSISSAALSAFNLSSSDLLTSRLDLAVDARNPNGKLVFLYDPISIAADSGGVRIGDGSAPGFVLGAGNEATVRATAASEGRGLDPGAAEDLRRIKKRLSVEIEMETRVGVKIGGFETESIGARVSCGGIKVEVPGGKEARVSKSFPRSRCEVKLLVPILNWTL